MTAFKKRPVLQYFRLKAFIKFGLFSNLDRAKQEMLFRLERLFQLIEAISQTDLNMSLYVGAT